MYVRKYVIMKNEISSKTNNLDEEFNNIVPFYVQNKDCLKMAHINVNSIRHKFSPLANLLTNSYLDILSVQETKLDDSFPNGQFLIPNFKMYRKDVKSDTGGITTYRFRDG